MDDDEDDSNTGLATKYVPTMKFKSLKSLVDQAGEEV